jgi:ribosomal protein L11
VFTIPPSSVPNIGDALLEKNVSFAYFGEQFNAYLANPYNNYKLPTIPTATSVTSSSTQLRL